MKENNEDIDITKLKQIKWKTNLSRNIDNFLEVISDEQVFKKYFSEVYVEKLVIKSKEIGRISIKLGIVYTLLMLSLFASQNITESEFEIFGYGFKNIGHYKEFLLFLAAAISPISAILVAYQKYINNLIKECIKKLVPNENIRKFYSHRYLDEYWDALIISKPISSNRLHKFSLFMMFLFGLLLFSLFFTLLAGSFLIQINVIYDVIINPASSYYINLFVVIFAISSILFSWIVSIIQLPMPEIDNSNYVKLIALEKENPEQYKENMKKLANESSRKEAFSLIILHSIVFTVTFSTIAIWMYPSILSEISLFLGKAMSGAFMVMFFSNQILGFIRKKGIHWFFYKYPNESDERLAVFIKVEKYFLLIKLLVPLTISIIYSLYVLS